MQPTAKAACGGRATAHLASFGHDRWPAVGFHKRSLLPPVSRVGGPAASLVWAELAAHRHNSSTLAAVQAPYGPLTETYAEEIVEGYDAELLDISWSLGREDAFAEQAVAEANLNTINENMEQLLRVLRENDAFIQQQQQQLDPAAQLEKSQLHRAALEHEGSDGEEEAWFPSPLDQAIIKGHIPSIRKGRKEEEKLQRAEKAAKRAQAAAERLAKREMRRTATAGPLAEPLTAPMPAADAASAAAARQLRREQRRVGSFGPDSPSAISSTAFPSAGTLPATDLAAARQMRRDERRAGSSGTMSPSAISSTASPSASSLPATEPMPSPQALSSQPATFNRGGPAETSQGLEAEFARSALEASLAKSVQDMPHISGPSASIAAPRSTTSSSTSASSRDVGTSALGFKQPQQSPVGGMSVMSTAPAVVPLALAPLAPSAVVTQQQTNASTRRGRSPRRTRGSTMQARVVAAPGDLTPLANLFQEAGSNVTLLSADEEKELAVVVQDLLMLEAKQVELAKELQRQPTLEEWGAAVGMTDISKFTARLASGRLAKNAMVKRNLRLVVAICKKFVGRGMQLSDLVSEGIAGLLKGVEKFDGSKGFKFSTYAHWWIRQAVGRSVSDQGRMVRLPVHLHEAWTKMRRAEKDLEETLRRRPSFSEIAQHLGWEEERLQEMYDMVRQPRSMDVPVYSEDGSSLGDVLEDETRMTPDESATADNVKRDVDGILSELNEREAGVVRMRFGLDDGVEHTLDDIGSKYNVTRERIRQIEAKALRRLRALQTSGKGRLSEYLSGELEEKTLAARSAGGLKKQS